MLSQDIFSHIYKLHLIKYIFLFLLSFSICLLIIFISKKYPKLLDKNFKDCQKYHICPTPRLGGMGIYISSLLGLINSSIFFKLILSSFPAFISGIFSDINRELSPKIRILFISLSAFLGIVVTNLYISDLDFITLNKFLCIFITFVGVLGFTNAINIIDGFNGLASGFSLIALFNFLLVAYFYKNIFLMDIINVFIFSILGFFVLNFPFGLIFLGDGGAYFLGYIFSFLCIFIKILLPQVSCFYPFLVLIYPIYEVMFSIYRKIKRKTSPFQPDTYHLHMLVYKAIKKFLRRKYMKSFNRGNIICFLKQYKYINEKINFLANPLTSVFIFLWILPFQILAFLFQTQPLALLICSLTFIFYYNLTYKLLVMYLKNKI
ncbi:MAG TPA: undecaprenyl/decaprenyl-phosphate alpha-N-acetylglucosaminyl 1-phosphate transferase [Aquificae bacterium]|nr:undecaprenyl/decaprenyl-phosphate alpha-N-acetylglucosaminyl 1-phosphate transferase [Aquificota bacterium]